MLVLDTYFSVHQIAHACSDLCVVCATGLDAEAAGRGVRLPAVKALRVLDQDQAVRGVIQDIGCQALKQ